MKILQNAASAFCALALIFAACSDDDSDFISRSGGNGSSGTIDIPSVYPCKTLSEDKCEYGMLTDERDGQSYRTVKIGDQWWMAENLNYETDSSFCLIEADSNCTKYARLYTGPSAAIACPNGWHLPSLEEWQILFAVVGEQSTAAGVLKSSGGWYLEGDGSDAYGFMALPAGNRSFEGDFFNEGQSAEFWSSTEYDGYSAFFMDLYYDLDNAGLTHNGKYEGLSVRCLKD